MAPLAVSPPRGAERRSPNAIPSHSESSLALEDAVGGNAAAKMSPHDTLRTVPALDSDSSAGKEDIGDDDDDDDDEIDDDDESDACEHDNANKDKDAIGNDGNDNASSKPQSSDSSLSSTSSSSSPPSSPPSTPPNPRAAVHLLDNDDAEAARSSRRLQQQCKASPAFYNPISNYAPNRRRPRRREIMGMSIVAFDNNRNRKDVREASYLRNYYDDDDDDASSLDSEQALERAAQRIRTELRIAEMAELAAEAERAADAGEESFAAQPSTYGMAELPDPADDRPDESNDREHQKDGSNHHHHHPKPRVARYPRFRRPRKVAITDLRGADDVFPSFGAFHQHLRTHLSRAAPPAKESLTLREDPHRPYGIPEASVVVAARSNSRHRSTTSSRASSTSSSGATDPPHFLGGWRLDRWIPGGPRRPDPATHAATPGDLVACHQHDPQLPIRPQRISVPEGLERLAHHLTTTSMDAATTHHSESRHRRRQRRQSDTSSSSTTASSAASTSSSNRTPSREDAPANTSFVTPARLRGIKDTSFLTTTTAGSDPANAIVAGVEVAPVVGVAPNSILQSHDRQDPNHQHRLLPPDPNPLMLPDFFDDSPRRSLALKPSNSNNSSTAAAAVKNPISSNDKPADPPGTSFAVPAPPATPEITTTTSKPATIMRRSGSGSSTTARRVKVSVFGGTPEQDSRKVVLQQSLIVVQAGTNGTTPDSSPGRHSGSSSSIRRSTSAGALEMLEQQQPHDPFRSSNSCNSSNRNLPERKSSAECKLHFEAAMNRLRELSPHSSRPSAVDNDAFLNNFLYCSKPATVDDPREMPDACLGGDSCRESIPCGADVDMEACCTSIITETAFEWLPRKPQDHHRHHHSTTQHIMLSRNTCTQSKAETDNWFDRANEKFDGVFNKFLSTPQTGKEWNVSFRAPSLNSLKPPQMTSITSLSTTGSAPKRRSNSVVADETEETAAHRNSPTTTADSRSVASSTRGHAPHHARHASMPANSLQGVAHEDLSNTEWELLYGSRVPRSPLRPELDPEALPQPKREDPQPQEDEEDDEEERPEQEPSSEQPQQPMTPVALGESFERVADDSPNGITTADTPSIIVAATPVVTDDPSPV